jgi:hypothetical protein
MPLPETFKIISGGQTGANRAALDWAIANGIPQGGACPKGRLAEDGCIPACYQLTELSTAHYPTRTERNVHDSDGTLIITLDGELSRGTMLTANLARKHGKPLLQVRPSSGDIGQTVRSFVERHGIRVLNVAGPRASGAPGIEEFVHRVLDAAMAL